MDLEKLMQKKITRKDFIKSIGFILLALIFFPRKALSFVSEKSYIDQKIKNKPKEAPTQKIMLNGVKAIEVIDDK